MPKTKGEAKNKKISLEDLTREEILALLRYRWFHFEQWDLWWARWKATSDRGLRLMALAEEEEKEARARGNRADWLKANAKWNRAYALLDLADRYFEKTKQAG